MVFAATFYITARICIIVLARMSLRCLLPSALVEGFVDGVYSACLDNSQISQCHLMLLLL